MNRRTVAGLLGAGLLLVLVLVAALIPVPYVTIKPGPTVDVLGTDGDKPIVTVQGHRTYRTEGELRLVTVSVSNPEHRVTLGEAIGSWVDTDDAVIPRAVMYPEQSSDTQERTESAAEMVSSQDTAIAAALGALGYRLPTYAEVTGVTPDGPSQDELKPRDRLLRVDGTTVAGVEQLFTTLKDVDPGDHVRGTVLRGSERVGFDVRTEPAPDDPRRAMLGILVGTGYRFPFEVEVGIDDSIGGPSAGLMFALSVYDTLTPGSLTGGAVVAGTGTISPEGAVGPIGGIRQKIVGAADAGARLFLVPAANCAEAVLTPVEPEQLRLVRAPSFDSALSSLRAYADDPAADLPRCPT